MSSSIGYLPMGTRPVKNPTIYFAPMLTGDHGRFPETFHRTRDGLTRKSTARVFWRDKLMVNFPASLETGILDFGCRSRDYIFMDPSPPGTTSVFSGIESAAPRRVTQMAAAWDAVRKQFSIVAPVSF
jgi:hypothetical protein